MNKFKAVLFDLDGTLINTIDDLANSVNFMLKSYNYPIHDVEPYKMMVGNGMRKLVERALPTDQRQEKQVTHALNVFLEHYNLHSMDNTVAYEGIVQTVEIINAAGFKTAVVTNKEEAAAKKITSKLFNNCFDVIIGQRDNLPTKPNPAGVHLAMKLLNVKPDECLFVGDSGVDIQTAVNSGAFPVGVLWGFRDENELKQNGTKVVINKPSQLLDLLDLGNKICK